MRAKAYEFYYALFLVPPYQKSVVFNVTLHISLIIASQNMWLVFGRNWQTIYK